MGRLFIASKLNTQKLRMIFAVLLLLAPSVFAQCGVGSQCKTKVGVETCAPCPAGTSCSQWTTSSGSLGAFYCQYTVCLAEGAFCNVYNSCTTAGGFSQPWCATTTNSYYINSHWGNCASNCPGVNSETEPEEVCMTESGATPNLPCVFPFRHWGKTYWTCTTDGDKKPWCSTKVDRYGNHQLGNWGDCNLASCMQRNDGN